MTCLYAILDPHSGRLQYANAGHDLPYQQHKGDVTELHATGMPLGLMPGMAYEEKETTLAPGETVLFYSDGLVEAHNVAREMFGFPRLEALLKEESKGTPLIDYLLGELATFTGPTWEQEDDVTLVTLQRAQTYEDTEITTRPTTHSDERVSNDGWRPLAEWNVPSEPGNERKAAEQVAETVRELKAFNIPSRRLEELKTAVAEATMNAMEYGNHYQPDLPVSIQVLASDTALAVRITDHGGGQPIPDPEVPDLDAKLAERQSPRGWGLFLIKNLVDEMHVTSDETHHTVELIIYQSSSS